MRSLFDWLDRRLDYRRFEKHLRDRVLPDGPSWWYTSASCLFWLLLMECFTGLMLMATYSPSMSSAWASVHFIDQTATGKFLRGVHHYTSHVMIILFGLHVMRVLVMGAYRAPREIVWITGLLLFPLVVVWTVTGNPLSASQKGVSQIQVEGSILGSTPLVGPWLQQLLIGGDEVGNLTLTRLYFLHVGLLPLLVGALTALHLQQVIKHSPYRISNATNGANGDDLIPYWPYQTVRNRITLAIVFGIIAWISWQHGAPLHAPADPELSISPRPEWYFRWLFELRRYFTGDTEFIATMVIPSVCLGAFMAAPVLDRFLSDATGKIVRVVVMVACVVGWCGLTYLSFHQDAIDPHHQAVTAEFEALSARALQLAESQPISENGAVDLLRRDPQTQGPRLFAKHCSSCHSYADAQGQGIVAKESSAPNLFGIGRPEWIRGFLDSARITSPDVFGQTAFRDGEMVQHIQGLFENADDEGRKSLEEQLQALALALAAEAGQEPSESEIVARGRELLTGELGCVDCHRFHDQGDLGSAPDLTGYASTAWLTAMIASPSDSRFYGDHNDRMPSFASDAEHPALNLMTPTELDLLIRWMIAPIEKSAK